MEFKWKKVSELLDAGAPKDADLLMVHDGSNLKKTTLQKLKEFIINGLAQKSYVDTKDSANSQRISTIEAFGLYIDEDGDLCQRG